jgi:hypothetical protein
MRRGSCSARLVAVLRHQQHVRAERQLEREAAGLGRKPRHDLAPVVECLLAWPLDSPEFNTAWISVQRRA